MKHRLSMACLLSMFLLSNFVFTQTFTLLHDSVEREYLVHVPASYNGSVAVPMVVALHGAGQNPANFESLTKFSNKSDEEGFIVAYPKGILPFSGYGNTGWNQNTTGLDDVGFVSAMLDSLFKYYNIDTARVYVTGFSIGGGMCYTLAKDLSNRVAAIAPVSPYVSYNFPNLFPSKPIPSIQFKSKNDEYNATLPIIKFWINVNDCKSSSDTILNETNIIGEEWRAQTNQSEVILYSPFSAGHVWMTAGSGISATDAIWDFFSRHSLASSFPFAATVQIQSPSDGNVFDIPAEINIRAEVTVQSGSIDRVAFFQSTGNQDEIIVGEALSAPYEINWVNNETGSYRIAAKALDASGNVLNPIEPISLHTIRRSIAYSGTVTSSSNQSTSFSAQKAFDRNFNTRWMSKYQDPQWILVDLGNIHTINAITLYWEPLAFGTTYQIQVSTDSLTWNEVYSTSTGSGEVNSITFDPLPARYARMLGAQRADPNKGYSLYEFLVHSDEINEVLEPRSSQLPNRFELNQNYPNPFNPSTMISYSIPKADFISLKVYDILGNEIQTLVNQYQSANVYSVNFNAEKLSSGVYFYCLKTGSGFIQTRKMMLVMF